MIRKHKGFLILTLIYLITFLLMLPLRDVSFEDDFAYVLEVQEFLATGVLKTPEWAAPAMLVQIALGGLFAKIFGYSIAILHLSNIVLFYFGLISFYFTLKRLLAGEFKPVLFSLFLLSYPWIFDFTYSFMTDIFYLSLFLISTYFYVRAFQTNSLISFLLGSLFAGLTYLQRQIGVAIPAAAAATFFFQGLATRRMPWKILLVSLVPAGLIVALYNYWLGMIGLTYAQYRFFTEPLQKEFFPKLIPQNLKNAIGQSQQYYTLAIIKRGLGYFDNSIAYLLPIFFIYKFKLQAIPSFIKQNFRYLSLTIMVITLAYILDFVTGKTYTSHMTSIIMRYDIFITPNWGRVWPVMVWVSRFIWAIIIAITIKQTFKSLLTQRTGTLPKLYKKLTKIYLISHLGMFLIFLQNNFPFMFSGKRISQVLGSFSFSPEVLSNLLSLKHLILGIRTGWFFFTITFISLTLPTYFLLTKKFKTLNKTSQPLLFLAFILIANLLLVCFINNNYYEEYVIQLVPILFIWIAYLLRNIPISYFRAVLIVSVMILFSVSSTRLRYQKEGLIWGMGVQEIEQGVNYDFISVNWPWRPYWYFKNEIPKLMEEYKDNKYKMPPEKFAGWSRTATASGTYYNSVIVTSESSKSTDVVLESEKFWLFSNEFPGIKWVKVQMSTSFRK